MDLLTPTYARLCPDPFGGRRVQRQTLIQMFELKPLDPDAIPAALEKAKHYRLLNEPLEAESICLDILELEPDHEEALATLVLSLTDQFDRRLKKTFTEAREVAARLGTEYDRSYYGGLIYERRAKVHLERGGPGSGHVAYDWFRRAMENYDAAAKIDPDTSDPILRWNTCARIIMHHPELIPEPHAPAAPFLDAGPGSHDI